MCINHGQGKGAGRERSGRENGERGMEGERTPFVCVHMQIEMLLIKNELITFPLVLGRLGGPAQTKALQIGTNGKFICICEISIHTLFLSAAAT